MLIRWSYRRTAEKMCHGTHGLHCEWAMHDTVITWRVLWVLFVPVFSKAVSLEKC